MAVIGEAPEEARIKTRLKDLMEKMAVFIHNASKEQRENLLSLLEDSRIMAILAHEEPEDRRLYPRKACSIAIDYATWGGAFKTMVENISSGGMFIQTRSLLSEGQQVTVSFPPPPKKHQPLKVTGEIVWAVPEGVGVRFTSVNADLKKIIASV